MDQETLRKDVQSHIATVKPKRAWLDNLAPKIERCLFSIKKTMAAGEVQISINNEMYDGSGITARKVWVAGVIGNVTPRGGDWHQHRFRDPRANRAAGVPPWQAELADAYEATLEESNWYEFENSFCETAGTYGTAAGYVEEDELAKTVTFKEIPFGTYWVDEGRDGTTNVMVLEDYLAGWEMLERWPTLPDPLATRCRDNPYTRFLITQVVRPRKVRDPEVGGNLSFPFESTVWADDFKILLEHSGFQEFPFLVYRVTRIHGTPWGGGPGIDFIRDGQIAQAVAETMLEADQKLVDPAREIDEQLRDIGYDTHPGSEIWVSANLVGQGSKPVNYGINTMPGLQREERLRQAAENHFNVGAFLMQSRAEKQMTRAEYLGRRAEQNAVLTPIFSGFSSQVLDILFPRLARAMAGFGSLPEPPKILAQMGFGRLVPIYQGPAATLRKQAQALTGVESLSNTVLGIKNAFPTLADRLDDNFDPDELANLAIEGNSVQGVQVDKATRDKNREAKRQAMVMQAQAQAQMGVMQATGGMN